MIKKILSLCIVLGLCLSLTACSSLYNYFKSNQEAADNIEEKPHLTEPVEDEEDVGEVTNPTEDAQDKTCGRFEVVELYDGYIVVVPTKDNTLCPSTAKIKIELDGDIVWENKQIADIIEVTYVDISDSADSVELNDITTIEFVKNKYDYSDVDLESLKSADITVEEVLDKLKAHNDINAENNKSFCDIDIDMVRNFDIDGVKMVGKLLCNIEEKYEQNEKAAFGDCYLRIFMSVDAPDYEQEQVVLYEEEALDVRADKENDKLYYQSNLDPKWKVDDRVFDESCKVQIQIEEVEETMEELEVMTDGKYYILPFTAIMKVVNEGEMLATTKVASAYIVTDKDVSGYMIVFKDAELNMDVEGSILVDAIKALGMEGYLNDESFITCSYTKGFYGLVCDDLIIDESIKVEVVGPDMEAPEASDGNVE